MYVYMMCMGGGGGHVHMKGSVENGDKSSFSKICFYVPDERPTLAKFTVTVARQVLRLFQFYRGFCNVVNLDLRALRHSCVCV